MNFTEMMINEMSKKNPKRIKYDIIDSKDRIWTISFNPNDPRLIVNISTESGSKEIDTKIGYSQAVMMYRATGGCAVEQVLKDAVIQVERFA